MVRLLSPYNTLLVVSRPGEKLDALEKEFPSINTYQADLSKPTEYETLVHDILQNHPKIDVLINNAAIQYCPEFLDDDFAYETITYEVNLNLVSICALSYLLLPALLNEKSESVIANINSGLALAPKTGSAVYCATKSAMNAFSQSLGYQLENTNVRVTQAFLPLVDTPMTQGRGKGKLSPERAAMDIICGIEKGLSVNNIGKVKLLYFLAIFAPWLARKIMKGS